MKQVSELCELGIRPLARMVREKKVSPLELCDAHIARIEEVNPKLTAVVRPLFDEARREARDMGERLTRGETDLPPFFGVPFTAKEHLKVKGLPNTGGLVKRMNRIAEEDAEPVARMRRAGFVLLGTTNVPEGLTWYETYNKVYGRTKNPYDTSRTSGGSSGGEAAIIAAGGSPIGIGGDMGGSIRLPAMMCGVCGHKPSGGRVPETGSWPGARGQLGRYKVLGPLARTVDDLRSVLPILEGPDGRDLTADAPPFADREFDPKTVKVYLFEDNGLMSPSDDIRRALEDSAASLRARGCQVERWTPPHMKESFQMWASALSECGGPKFIEVVGDGEEMRIAKEWILMAQGKSDHIFPVVALATLEKLLTLAPGFRKSKSGLRESMQSAIEDKLGENGVLLCPVFHRTAPRHGLDAMRSFLGFTYSGVLNPLELPATSVPTGFGADGLPTGVQLAGVRLNDALTLRTAEWLEEDLGGWRPTWRTSRRTVLRPIASTPSVVQTNGIAL